MILSLWSYVRGLPDTRWNMRGLETVRRAEAVLTVSLLVVGAAAWLILITHPVSATVALFEVVSAFATTGVALSFTGQLNLFGQLIIGDDVLGQVGGADDRDALAKPGRLGRSSTPRSRCLIGQAGRRKSLGRSERAEIPNEHDARIHRHASSTGLACAGGHSCRSARRTSSTSDSSTPISNVTLPRRKSRRGVHAITMARRDRCPGHGFGIVCT